MSAGLVCDKCGSVIVMNERGDSPDGEDAAWVHIELHGGKFPVDLCSRSCATEWLTDPEVVAAMDEWLETIVGIARIISGDDEDEDR